MAAIDTERRPTHGPGLTGWLRAAGALGSPLYRNGLALVASAGVTAAVGLGYWAVAARTTSESTLGVNSTLISAMLAVSWMSQLGLAGALMTYLPRSSVGRARLVLVAYITASGIGLVVSTAFVLVAPDLIPALRILRSGPNALLFVAATIAWIIFCLQDSVLTGLRRAVWIPLENLSHSVVKLGLLIPLASGLAGLGIFVSWAVPSALLIVPVSIGIFGRFVRSPAPGAGRQHGDSPVSLARFTQWAAADGLASLLAQTTAAALPLIVSTRLGVTAAALFSIPWMLAQALDLLAINFGMSLVAEGAHDVGGASGAAARLRFRLAATVAAAAGGGILLAPYLLAVFGPTYGSAGTPVLRLLLIASVFRTITAMAGAAARIDLAPRRIILLQVWSPLVIVPAVWLLTPELGIEGAAAAWLAGQVITALAGLTVGSVPRSSAR